MNLFKNIIVAEIQKPFTVFSKKGRTEHTEQRPFYGLSFCLGGQITYMFNGKKIVSNKNNAVILPMGATSVSYTHLALSWKPLTIRKAGPPSPR